MGDLVWRGNNRSEDFEEEVASGVEMHEVFFRGGRLRGSPGGVFWYGRAVKKHWDREPDGLSMGYLSTWIA